MTNFYSLLNHDIDQSTSVPLIRRKYYMASLGIKNYEIFKYSVEFWNKYERDGSIKFPYILDGLVYHPLVQTYNVNMQESKYHEYKWKPPNKNSIEFYIEFKKPN